MIIIQFIDHHNIAEILLKVFKEKGGEKNHTRE